MNVNDTFNLEQYDEAYKFVCSHNNTTIEDLGGNSYKIIELPIPTLEELNKIEKERVDKLRCTKRNFVMMLQQLGISYNQIKDLISTNEQAQLEWDLCVELLRGNPLLDSMGEILNLTPLQIDKMFKYANGEVENFMEK